MSKRRSHRSDRDHRDRPDAGLLRGLIDRMEDRGFGWDDVQDDVMPIFERARPFSLEVDRPARTSVPPGVTIGFGVDLGLAFARVSVVHLAGWPVDIGGLTDRALRNLRKRGRHAPDYDLVGEAGCGVPARAFPSRGGWGGSGGAVP